MAAGDFSPVHPSFLAYIPSKDWNLYIIKDREIGGARNVEASY